MEKTNWVIVDTETDGLMPPIHVVEIAAQLMCGWEPCGQPFQVFLNHEVFIPSAVVAIHGYTQEFLRENGQPPVEAHESFRTYVKNLPIVAHNLAFDWNRALMPEWNRLGLSSIGSRGFCTMLLSRRVLFDSASFGLDALKREFSLGAEPSHKAQADVRTVIRLFTEVLRPRLDAARISTFAGWNEFSRRTPLSDCKHLISTTEKNQNVRTYYLRPSFTNQAGIAAPTINRQMDLKRFMRGLADKIKKSGSLENEDVLELKSAFYTSAKGCGCRMDRWFERVFNGEQIDSNEKRCLEAALVRMMYPQKIDEELTYLGMMDRDDFLEKVEAAKQSATVDFDTPREIKFNNHNFCFTGTFAYGTRDVCEAAVSVRGGSYTRRPTVGIDYLIVGSLGGFGSKVAEITDMKLHGSPVQIIAEEFWVKSLKNEKPRIQ